MDKVMVSLYIPATGKNYDIRLPQSLSVSQATELISVFFANGARGAFIPDASSVLCDRESGNIYPVNSSIQKLKLKNGSRLMLI